MFCEFMKLRMMLLMSLTVCLFVCMVGYQQSLKEMESEKLQVQIQAYLDNVFDVGALLEDAESKGDIMEHVTELQETNAQVKYTPNTIHTNKRAHNHLSHGTHCLIL